MKAIIMSAGKGSRMYPLTANTPKCLIDIGHGKTVLESQLDVLKECEIDEVYIVAGYRIQQVRAKISDYPVDSMRVRVVQNPFYASSNNIISLWLTSSWIKDPCISINGDNIFKKSVIQSLLNANGEIVMTIDRKEDYDADDMLVITEGESIKAVGKDLDRKQANGESIGIIKYSKLGLEQLNTTLDHLVQNESNHQIFYLSALQEIMNKGFPVLGCEVEPDDWAEIDFHPDVSDVRERVDSFVQRMK